MTAIGTVPFPTLHGIPVYPSPSIYETTRGRLLTEDGVTEIGPREIEEIQARPPWDFHEADTRLMEQRVNAYKKAVDEATRVRPQRKPAAKRKTSAAKKTTTKKGPRS